MINSDLKAFSWLALLVSIKAYISDRKEISENGCWEWTLKVRRNGYARCTFMGNSWYAHRLSYEAYTGRALDGFDICHSCDNRKCVNPRHLFQGTRKDNMQDAVSKGRQAKGFMLPATILSESNKLEIKTLLSNGNLTQKEIGSMYGVSRGAINNINIKIRNGLL